MEMLAFFLGSILQSVIGLGWQDTAGSGGSVVTLGSAPQLAHVLSEPSVWTGRNVALHFRVLVVVCRWVVLLFPAF